MDAISTGTETEIKRDHGDEDGDDSNDRDGVGAGEDNIKENPTVKERQAHGYETPGVAFYLLSVQSIS